jgi:hypothetical protein
MTPTQQGRFCNKCEKPVVDFTGFTDQQVLQYFLTNPFPVCGRLQQAQREHTFIDTSPKINRSLSPVAAATLLTLTAISMAAAARNTPHPVAIQQVQQSNKQAAALTLPDSVIITGIVKDEHGAPLENAAIVCGEIKLLSDKNGYFRFTLQTAINKPAVIKFSYGKLEPQVRSYHPVMGSTSYDVVLYAGYMPMGFQGLIEPSFRLNLPDTISTLTFRHSEKLDKPTKEFLSTVANLLRNYPELMLSLKSSYKSSPKKATNLTKQVLNYLVDSEGISEDRFRLPRPQHKKDLTSEVSIELRQTKPEE